MGTGPGADPGFSLRPQSVSLKQEQILLIPGEESGGPCISPGSDEPRTRADWSAGPGAGMAWNRLSPALGGWALDEGTRPGEWRLGATSGLHLPSPGWGQGLWGHPRGALLP